MVSKLFIYRIHILFLHIIRTAPTIQKVSTARLVSPVTMAIPHKERHVIARNATAH